ncbi:MAG: FAD-dependent 5-carboxymethylaminomethyl-2-thiouridine(34) oxidoreductase MnmC [Rhodospirillales bacterium]
MTDPHLPDPMIEIGDDGTPVSRVSGDVYFSRGGGIEETRHVFLNGIGAPEVWRGRRRFRIGELGFGTGLNFLVTWRDWKATAPPGAQLDYTAVEGYPIPVERLRGILAQMPELADEAAALLAAWPVRVGGMHRLHFDAGRVRLTLLFGAAGDMLKSASGEVDAWFLDGFAPARNPDMWSADMLIEVRRLSAPGARLATFSAAGAVRRGLTDVGFAVEKRAGFGRKRDCISAVLPGDEGRKVPESVAVIGAGIAGCTLARSLAARGMAVTLIDRAEAPGAGASGNPAALLAPRLPRERTALGRIMAASYLFAVRYYDTLADEGAPVWLGARGGLALARNDDEAERQSRAVAAFGWPDDVMRTVDAGEAADLCGIRVDAGGLWFSGAGTLSPPAITGHLATYATYVQSAVGGYEKMPDGWQLLEKTGAEIGTFDAVVLAAGTGLMELAESRAWPLRANRGQLAYLPEIEGGPRVPVTYGGYVTPAVPLPGGGTGHVLGATYARRDEVPAADWENLRAEDEAQMLNLLGEHLSAVSAPAPAGGRVSLRATIRDYVPLAGEVENGLYVLGGLGSRGFLTAPLLSELIADRITGAPLPLEADLVRALAPARFG